MIGTQPPLTQGKSELVQKYRALQQELDTGDVSMGRMYDMLEDMNTMLDQANRTSEVKEDAKTHYQMSGRFNTNLRRLADDRIEGFDLESFVDKFRSASDEVALRMLQKENPETTVLEGKPIIRRRDFVARLGGQSYRLSNRPPMADFMNGVVRVEKKVRQVRRGERLKISGDQKKPQEIGANQMQQGANQQSRLIQMIYELLVEYTEQNDTPDEFGRRGIELYMFTNNPVSPVQSIENMFYVSFLVRDNRVALWYDKGVPMIGPVEGQEESIVKGMEAIPAAAATHQAIVDVDIDMVQKFGEWQEDGLPLIPNRTYDENGFLLDEEGEEEDDEEGEEEEKEEEKEEEEEEEEED
ncbi:hypothetical protein TRVA0_077S00122 [Trichomonascus vanleenenianus]|uniref:Smc5-Smc6 complex subunit NSE4 n=1 Tax=Trichomonascus vanleenenianus TaxID=2268995 RepID=UPI003ECAED3B